MEFRIADTFTASLCKLTADEQKLVKQTAFDAQVNPSSPGLRFHKLDRGRDKNFWSLSVGMDIRIIVHRTAQSLLFCYVDHHDGNVQNFSHIEWLNRLDASLSRVRRKFSC